MRLNISRPARTDLKEIWLYIAQNSDGTDIANQAVRAILMRLEALQISPYIGRSRSEDIGDGIRSLPIGNYIAYYLVTSKSIDLVRIIHGMRNIQGMIF